MSFLKNLAQRTKEVTEEAAEKAVEKLGQCKVDSEIRETRMNLCRECEHYISATSTCKKCGCFMIAKTYLSHAECPVGKWTSIIREEK